MANNDNFAQDVTEQLNGNAENGGGDGQHDNSSAEASGRDDDRKLFVGGLSWETTDKELRDHFSAYGEIESINVKTDPNTGRSRGFAFIVFKQPDAIDKVMGAGEHIINNKKVDPKKAKARHGKIFVGGLSAEISDDEIKNFFGNFGTIMDVEMPFDKTKNQRKGFCFITFESEQVVNELLKTPKQTIAGKEVDVKRATPKPAGGPPPQQYAQPGPPAPYPPPPSVQPPYSNPSSAPGSPAPSVSTAPPPQSSYSQSPQNYPPAGGAYPPHGYQQAYPPSQYPPAPYPYARAPAPGAPPPGALQPYPGYGFQPPAQQ